MDRSPSSICCQRPPSSNRPNAKQRTRPPLHAHTGAIGGRREGRLAALGCALQGRRLHEGRGAEQQQERGCHPQQQARAHACRRDRSSSLASSSRRRRWWPPRHDSILCRCVYLRGMGVMRRQQTNCMNGPHTNISIERRHSRSRSRSVRWSKSIQGPTASEAGGCPLGHDGRDSTAWALGPERATPSGAWGPEHFGVPSARLERRARRDAPPSD